MADIAGGLETFLRGIPLFAELGPGEIAQLIDSSKRVVVGPGEQIITEGAVGDMLVVILEGQFEVSKKEGGQVIVLATRGAGDFLGEMSLLEQVPRTASVRSVTPGEILEIEASTFQQVLKSSPQMATTILRTVAGRLRSTESSLMQREKLASLGTLAAGLAHELNNPSAAIQRSSAQLVEALRRLDDRVVDLMGVGLDARERQHLFEQLRRPKTTPSPPEAMAEEDRLIETLEALGSGAAYDIAPSFAALGWKAEDIEALAGGIEARRRTAVLQWVGTAMSARELSGELERSAKAVSDIVRAVKSYTYLDQAEVQDIDVMMSLEDTLMILKHKLKGIEVTRDYAPDLPRVEGYGSELNQVWTNLIDNAIDAMNGEGTIDVRAARLDETVEVRIGNTGPAIPSHVAKRIFEPFFTTKPQGVGTGLGLHVSRNIVVNRHGGEIDLTSVPGRTEFRIRVPTRLRKQQN
ncbi:MAG: ATP-binding protein [Devosia sp.]